MALRLQQCNFAIGDMVLHSAFWPCGRAQSLFDRVIASYGRGPFCHAALLDHANGRWVTLEMDAKRGGIESDFFQQVRKWPGTIHWFRVPLRISFGSKPPSIIRYDDELDHVTQYCYKPNIAIQTMRGFLNRPYGWRQIFRDWCWHTPIIRQFLRMPKNGAMSKHNPVCSVAVSLALNAGFSWDLIPFLNDSFVEPNDLARCPVLRDMGTLIP